MMLQRRSKQLVIIVGLVFVVLLLVWLSAHWHVSKEDVQNQAGSVPREHMKRPKEGTLNIAY
jgi:hypothetical protein